MLTRLATGLWIEGEDFEKITAFGHVQILHSINNLKFSIVPVSTKQGFYPEFIVLKVLWHYRPWQPSSVIRMKKLLRPLIAKVFAQRFYWAPFKISD